VRASAELLSDSAEIYVFISSLSAYSDFRVKGMDEAASVATLTSEQLEKANQIDSSGQTSAVTYGEIYGGLKALCERAVEDVVSPNRALIIRPGLIVGAYDYTDRFTYWVDRISRGGEVLAPGRPDRYIQFIDGCDLAEWTVRMIEGKRTGIFNANGLPGTLTMKLLLEECRNVSGSNASFTWVSEDFLLREKVAPWSEMPLWMPEKDAPELEGFMFINSDKAVAAGLRFRDLNDTIRETLSWHQRDNQNQKLKAGIDADKELAVLRHWHESAHS
jgi:2'-hydroxyisoflavone reductase